MKDYLGNELQVGDEVIFPYPNYRGLVTGKILKITPQKVKMEYVHQNYSRTYTIEGNSVILKKERFIS